MAKNIAFCADGTWNGVAKDEDGDGLPDETNVLKLFHNLAGLPAIGSTRKADEQESVFSDANGRLRQVSKYLHGVGDSRNPIAKLLGGVLGSGIIKRIVRGYTFISRNYDPGDQIYLTGFSRGAYTARALAGLIASVGILDKTKVDLEDKELAYRLGIQAWRCYRQNAGHDPDAIGEFGASDVASIPRGALITPAHIRAVGVWDTVGALGLPLYAFGGGRVDIFKFADTRLSANVQLGFHAVSIDELRADFSPTLWDVDPRVEQVLFCGAHADVGGGYPNSESGLSDCALVWLSRRMEGAGLLFAETPVYVPAPDPLGIAHTPWKIVSEFFPSPRKFSPLLLVHQSVLERVRQGAPAYFPENLRDYADAATRRFLEQHIRVVE